MMSRRGRTRSRREALRRAAALAALVLVGILGAVTVVEAVLRTLHVAPDNFWQPDPVLGHFHIPGRHGHWRSACFSAPVQINALGFRDHDYPPVKQAGRLRIAVLGDSMTEGLQVRLEETYPKVLERLLNEVSGTDSVEILNLGVSGYGTGQQYLLWRERGRALAPDVVVLPMFPLNDVRESSFRLEGRADKPYFYLDGADLALRAFQYPPPYHRMKQLVRSLHLYRVFGARLGRQDSVRELLLWLGIGTQINPALDREWRGAAVTIPFDLNIYSKEEAPSWREAWSVVSAIIGQLNDEVARAGSRLVIVGLPSILEIVAHEKVQGEYPEFDAERFDTSAPHRQVEGIARARGIPYVALVPAFRRAVEAGRDVNELYYPCDLHYAPEGHRLVARTLLETIQPLVAEGQLAVAVAGEKGR